MSFLKKLKAALTKRMGEIYPECKKWDLRDWAIEMNEEAGEVLGVIKKWRRTGKDFGPPFEVFFTPYLAENGERVDDLQFYADLQDEVADVFMTCVLVAMAADIDLKEAVIRKFNEKSDKKGSNVYL